MGTTKKAPHLNRRVHIDGEVWWYLVGTSSVLIQVPGVKRKLTIGAHLVTGRDIERGRWKKTDDGTVFPSDMRRFIENHQQVLRSANMPAEIHCRPHYLEVFQAEPGR